MQVTRSGYYAWRKRQPSERHKQSETLRGQIRTFFERGKGTYGSPRILRDLREAGVCCGKHRVAKMMCQTGLRALVAPRFPVTTDLLHWLARDFSAPGVNVKWASDIT
jgi:transposase InsO family protein